MKKRIGALAALALTGLASAALSAETLRPPAVPLVTSDPYLSIWSEADKLTDDTTRHWTHHPHSLVSLIRVDGKTFRLMGKDPAETPAFPQTSVQALPTRSIYEFQNENVHVTLTFMTAALPSDMEALARPLSYITWAVRSVDGAAHAVSLYDSASSELAVNTTDQPVSWSREKASALTALKIGTVAQPLLTPPGDDTRIDWGYAYLVAPAAQSQAAIGSSSVLIQNFLDRGALPDQDDTQMPRAPKDNLPALAVTFNLGNVGTEAVSRHVMVGYDELYAVKFFGKKLRPYWKRNNLSAGEMFQAAERDYPTLVQKCEAFDRDLMADLTKVGGARYAQIAALAYRQCLAANGIAADANKQPLMFTKENTSNGDIATVDVFYPMDPIWIALSPTLAKASLVPILNYAKSWHWKFPNAPHDLGTYPNAKGTDDGGEGMPVEESGNMLLLCDAIAQTEGNASFVKPWWDKLTQWAQYLEKYGNDPEEQLCTDDFMGHLAHNANLSVKAIVALAAYGDLCRMRGDQKTADRYRTMAKQFAQHWMEVANDGDHYRLAFDKPNTWSQKYNLAWDRILGLNVFPPSVAQKEVAFYKTVMQPFGVPLDSRTRDTKTDWTVWSATLATNPADFEALISPVYDYLNQTTARQPLADEYHTDDINSVGMHARPVVGGIFIKMLSDKAVWKKWAGMDRMKVGGWAGLPPAPKITVLIPTSQTTPATWRYTTDAPGQDWTKAGFDDASWKQGPGGFGTAGTPGAVVGTTWNTGDIWLRREVTIPNGPMSNLQFLTYHDEDVEIYVNGVLASQEGGYVNSYGPLEISGEAKQLLKPGAKVTIAVHCHQTDGGQGVDVGLVNVVEGK